MNQLHFKIRNIIKIQKKGKINTFEPKKRIDILEKEHELRTKYEIENWRNISPAHEYYVSLHYLSILETFLPAQKIKHVIDVGSKNFFYAAVMSEYFKKMDSGVRLTGIELDGYRRYENWFTRAEYANHYIKDLPNTTYIVGDYLESKEKADVITMFLPFMTLEPLINWGLPKEKFVPLALMKHAWEQVESGGTILVVNQEKEEQDKLFLILQNLEIPYKNGGSYYSPFYNKYNHYVTVISKDGKIEERKKMKER